MSEEDKALWSEIRPKRTATYYQRTVMADLMTKYYGAKHKVPWTVFPCIIQPV